MTKPVLPLLSVSLTHNVCSIHVCQIHEETTEWVNECLLMNFFTENKTLLTVDLQACLPLKSLIFEKHVLRFRNHYLQL